MRLPAPTSLRITRPAAALALTAALGLGGVALAASDTGGFAALRDALLGKRQAPSFSITVSPASQTVTAGQGTSYAISIFQRKYRTPVRLRVVSRLPAGVSAVFAPNPANRRARLSLATTAATAPGTYRVSVHAFRGRPATPASARRSRSALRRWERRTLGRRHMTRTVRLIIRSPATAGRSLRTGGYATRKLAPGITSPVDAWVENAGDELLSVTSLTTSVAGLAAPMAAGSLTCDNTDFEVRQFSGPPFTVPPRATRKLSELGVPESQWPQLTMLNRPVSQDGCKGATLALAFSAAGRQAG